MIIQFHCLSKTAQIPQKATIGSSGYDLQSLEDCVLLPGERKLFKCGFSMEIPFGFEGQVRSRSGLSLKHGIVVANSPGTIDCDYRGEVGVIICNISQEEFKITKNMKIAQLVICPVELNVEFKLVDQISETERGSNGFGSSGL